MIRLRRLAIVLVAIGLVTSAIYATGAFHSLTTQRNANVDVVGDKAGYLGLSPGENGQYTTYQNGELQLRLSGALAGEDAPSGQGVNRDAVTKINSVFTITNQGTQSVGVWLADTSDAIAFERDGGNSLEGKGNAVQLTPGDTVIVDINIKTHNLQKDMVGSSLIIHADNDMSEQAGHVGSSTDEDESSGSVDTKGGQNSEVESTSQNWNVKSKEDSGDIVDGAISFVDEEVLGDTDEKVGKHIRPPQKEDVVVASGGAAIIGSYAASSIDFDDDGNIVEITDLDGDGDLPTTEVKERIGELRKGDLDGDGDGTVTEGKELIRDVQKVKVGIEELRKGDLDGDGDGTVTEGKEFIKDIQKGDLDRDGNNKDEKRVGKMFIDSLYGEYPPIHRDPGFAPTYNIITTLSKYDIDGDGVKLYEHADDPWECGHLHCADSEHTPGWNGPQFPLTDTPDDVMEV